MRRLHLALLLSCALPVAAAAAPRHAFDEHGLEHHVPASTLAFVEFQDMTAMKAAFHDLGLVKLMHDPGMQAFLRPALQFAKQMLAQEAGNAQWAQMAMQVLRGMNLVEGQIAFALIDAMAPDGLPVTMAAAIDFGANRERFQNGAHEFLSTYGVPHELVDFADHHVIAFDLGGMPLYATFAGSRLVLANSKSALEDILLGKHREASLAGTESFQQARDRVTPGGAGMFAYVSVQTLMERFREQMDAQMGMMESMLIRALGVDSLGGIGYGMRFEGRDVVERFHLESTGASNPLLDFMSATQPAKHSVARWIPADAWWYSNAGLRLVGYYDMVVDLASQMEDPEEVARQIEEFESQVLGFDIRGALASFGSEITFAMHAPTGGGLLPEITLFLAVEDPARLADNAAQLLEVLSNMLSQEGGVQLSAKAHEYLGMTYHTLDVSFTYGNDPFPLRPSAMIHDGQLVLTLVPMHMKNVIERIHAGSAKPSIADAGPVHAALAHAPQGHVQFSYVDLTGLATVLWNTGIPIAQAFLHGKVLEDVPFELELAHLPTARVIREHVGPMVGWVERDGSSVTSTLHSPCGVLPMVGLGVAVLIPVTVRQAQAARYEAMEAERTMELRRAEMEEILRQLEEGKKEGEGEDPVIRRRDG